MSISTEMEKLISLIIVDIVKLILKLAEIKVCSGRVGLPETGKLIMISSFSR